MRRYLYGSGSQGLSPRFRHLHRLDTYYRGQEYDGLKYTWDGFNADDAEGLSAKSATPFGFSRMDIPLHARKPSISLRLTPLVVERFTDLLFSNERKPKIRVEDDPDSEDFLKAVVEQAHFFRSMVEARNYGGAMGSALVTVHLREGRFIFKAHSPKMVQEVVWKDADLRIPEGVLIQYQYFEGREMLDSKTGAPTGQVKQVPFLFRRIIDDEMDITFKPTEIVGGELPNPEVDLLKTYRHNLGRFPGFWIQNLPSSEDLDGLCDVDSLHEDMEVIDRQISQSNSGLLKNQDPTLVIARDRKNVQFGIPLRKGSDNALEVGTGGSAQYLEIGGAGIQAAAEFVRSMKNAVLDKAGAVIVDPEKISGAAQSAKAIEFIYGPMLAKADRLRDQYGEAIIELLTIVLLLAREFKKPTNYQGNVEPRFKLTNRVEIDDESGEILSSEPRDPGAGERVTLKWGAYFSKTPTDIQSEVGTLSVAKQSRMIDNETAVRMCCELLGIDDVDAVLERLETDRQQDSLIASDAEGGGFYPVAEPADGGEGDEPADEGGEVPPGGPEAPDPGPGEASPDGAPAAEPDMQARAQEILDRHKELADQPAEAGGADLASIVGKSGDREYNGAQIASAMEVVKGVAAEEIPRDSGIAFLVIMLGLTESAAEAVMAEVGKSFVAKAPAPPPYGG